MNVFSRLELSFNRSKHTLSNSVSSAVITLIIMINVFPSFLPYYQYDIIVALLETLGISNMIWQVLILKLFLSQVGIKTQIIFLFSFYVKKRVLQLLVIIVHCKNGVVRSIYLYTVLFCFLLLTNNWGKVKKGILPCQVLSLGKQVRHNILVECTSINCSKFALFFLK